MARRDIPGQPNRPVNYDYEYEFIGNGTKIVGAFTQTVSARDEAAAQRAAYGFARSKAHDLTPKLVGLVRTNDPRCVLTDKGRA